MKNFLAFLAVLVVVVAGAGWYLGWFSVSTIPLLGGHKRVSVDIDTNKVKSDVTKGGQVVIEKGKEALETVVDKASEEAAKQGSQAVKKQVNNTLDHLKMPGSQEESGHDHPQGGSVVPHR
jgi:hypothetical protein